MDPECEGAAMSLTPIYPTYSPLRNTPWGARPARPVMQFHGNWEMDGMCSYCGSDARGIVIAGCLDSHVDEIELCQRCLTYRWEQPTQAVYFACPEPGCELKIDQWNIYKGKLRWRHRYS